MACRAPGSTNSCAAQDAATADRVDALLADAEAKAQRAGRPVGPGAGRAQDSPERQAAEQAVASLAGPVGRTRRRRQQARRAGADSERLTCARPCWSSPRRRSPGALARLRPSRRAAVAARDAARHSGDARRSAARARGPSPPPKAFTFPMANGPRAHQRPFSFGNRLFNTNWVMAPGSVKSFDGLGPMFNRVSCSGCHTLDGRGAPPADGKGPFDSMLIRLSRSGQECPWRPQPAPRLWRPAERTRQPRRRARRPCQHHLHRGDGHLWRRRALFAAPAHSTASMSWAMARSVTTS